MSPWLLRVAACLALAAVVLWLQTPGGPHSVQSGGFDLNGRLCDYMTEDARITRLIVFDSDWLRGCEELAAGYDHFSFRRADGRSFELRQAGPVSLTIDGAEYRLSDGTLFLATVRPGGNVCRQVPTAFRDADRPLPPGEHYVRGELQRMAGEFPEVGAFLGLGAP